MDMNNDGIYDYDGLLDTLLSDCNGLMRNMADGQYIQFCNRLVGMAQKIQQLKEGVKNDLDAKDRQIMELKKVSDDLAAQVTGLPVDDGPAVMEDEL